MGPLAPQLPCTDSDTDSLSPSKPSLSSLYFFMYETMIVCFVKIDCTPVTSVVTSRCLLVTDMEQMLSFTSSKLGHE